MKKRYLILVRKAYRQLRHRRLRRIEWLQNFIRPLFSRQLWRPTKQTVAKGLTVGMFFSMIPLPGQMLLACLITAKIKGNMPFNLLACWMSNPFTILPILVLQESLGEWIQQSLKIESSLYNTLDRFELVTTFRQTLYIPEHFHTGALIIGVITSAVFLSAICYPLVYGICFFFPEETNSATKHLPRTNQSDTTNQNS